MDEALRRSFRAGWGQMDFNAHMANTAYLDLAADTRLVCFAELPSSLWGNGAGSGPRESGGGG